jgi:hypothetical protein
VRCGAALSSVDGISVVPPRARSKILGARSSYRLRKGPAALGEAVKRLFGPLSSLLAGRDATARTHEATRSFARAFLLSIIPGLGQWRDGRKTHAKILVTVWLVLLGLSIFYPMLIGFAVSANVFAMMDILYRNRPSPLLTRILVSILCMALFWFVVYLPTLRVAGTIGRRMYVPARTVAIGFNNVDRCLIVFGKPRELRRFDLVEYQIDGVTPAGIGNYMIRGGPALGFVIATAGEEVSFNDGKILVDGEAPVPEESRRLVDLEHWPRGINNMKLVPKEDQVFVLPADGLLISALQPADQRSVIKHVCLVSETRVTGRGVMILRPLSHFGFMRD